jgi:hypothetical protein
MANTMLVAIPILHFRGRGFLQGVFHGLYAGLDPVTVVVSGKLGLGDGEKKALFQLIGCSKQQH